ncbi:MAG: cyclase family protein [Pseudomonadales bacterium]
MRRIIDLSLEISNNMLVHPLLQSPVVLEYMTHENTKEVAFGTKDDPITGAMHYISMLDSTGTHVDGFFHNDPEGLTVDEMPLDMFFGKAVCLDLTHIPDFGVIDVDDLKSAEQLSGVVIDGHITLLNTGLHKRHWPNVEAATNQPRVTAEATRWLASKGCRVHGVEGPSTDPSTNTLFESHRACRDLGVTHYEWLVNLEELVGQGEFTFFGVPLKLKGGPSGPVRAFAILE